MTSEEFQSKCVQISHFIHYELSNWIDLAVFTQNSFEDLGELYYQHILSHVDMASIDLINRVVKADSPKSFIFEQQADYISVSDEFLSVVKGLFKCNLSHDVRNILGNVHAALVKIKSFH